MARSLYTLLFHLLLPFVLLRLLWRALRAPAYARRVGERLGWFASRPPPGGIWLHTVSVGEFQAALPLLQALRQRYPDVPLTVTTMTPTGSARVRETLGDAVFHVYAPWDLPWAISAFLRRVQPRLAIVMETELWPNMVHGCRRRGVPVLLANARLSARSARGYARVAAVTRPLLRELSAVAAQTRADARRLRCLGLPAARLQVTGSIKFDVQISETLRQRAAALRQQAAGRPVWVAASTHEGEENLLLQVHQRLLARWPGLLLILVPRHPERFARVAELLDEAGLSFQRRSAGDTLAAATQVLLGDTMGELMALCGAADMAFVGGSLIPRGGHNTLEPAAWGLPLATGPSDFNFREISRLLRRAGALVVCEDGAALSEVLARWLEDPAARRRAGAAAAAVVADNRGALERLLALVDAQWRAAQPSSNSR